MNSASNDAPLGPRQALRRSLLAQRENFLEMAGFDQAREALGRHLVGVLAELEPEMLGLYWPYKSEFNAAAATLADDSCAKLGVCLPYAQRNPVRMHYRAWDRLQPTTSDECGILSSHGPVVVPDVVLVPCVGYTRDGFRLGYGGGYFDRWLAAHPDVTAVGVAWRIGEIPVGSFVPQAHDLPLTLIVTEAGVV